MKNQIKVYCKEVIPFIESSLNTTFVVKYSENGYFKVNPCCKDMYAVETMNGSGIQKFTTIQEAVEYAKTLPYNSTEKRIGIREYKKRKYSIIAKFI